MAVPNLHAQLVVAHRGASFDAPENTLSAFELAWEQLADVIEGDFYLTGDGQIVCIHDDTTERVGGKIVQVAESTYGELKEIDVGSWKDPKFADQRIPLLQDVLQTIPDGKQIFIEIKCGPEIVPALKKRLTRSKIPPSQASIISFQKEVIAAAKKAMPERQAFWLISFDHHKETGWQPTVEHVIATAKAINADGVDVQAITEVVNSDFVAACRDAALGVHVWTVDEGDIASHFQQLGVDSITTNRPDFLRKVLVPVDALRTESPSELIGR